MHFLASSLFAILIIIFSNNETLHVNWYLIVLLPLLLYTQHLGITNFLKIAKSKNTVIDKVIAHSYHVMYGMFLLLF